MFKRFLFISGLFCQAVFAQQWQQIGLDSFNTDLEDRFVLKPGASQFGAAIQKQAAPEFTSYFWIGGDWWFLESPEHTDVYYTFGKLIDDSLHIWAAGYSLAERKITFGKLMISASGKIHYSEITKKPVEIIDHRLQYVFRFLFFRETNEIKIEVNGVPMLYKLPTPVSGFTQFGYMVSGGITKFQKMKIWCD